MIRQFGGDVKHTQQIVDKQRASLARWVELKGGAEYVHKHFHASAIVAAKPKVRGKITKIGNPYAGSYISDYGDFYFVSLSTTKGKADERRALTMLAPQLGGFGFTLNGTRGYVIPRNAGTASFIQSLSVKWGV